MKKFVVVCLSLAMALSMSLSALAAPGVFVKSPSANPAPELVEVVNASEGCDAYIVITPYAERDTLDAPTREKLEAAYVEIVNSLGDNNFSEALKALAQKKNMNVNELAVSDLFDISYHGCEVHEYHKGFTIKLKSETIQHFVGLLHQNGEAWEEIEVTEVNTEENTITFYVDDLSPFAIVVDTSADQDSPQTGDQSGILLGVMGVAAAGLIVIAVASKKRKSHE